jgi:D-alanine-D-alanine ligase
MNNSPTTARAIAKTNRKASNRQLANVLGPVDNLESYVKADWWKHIFNANYLRTDGDVVNDESITHAEVDVFEQLLNLEKNANILDLCCGQGRHVMEFARRNYINVNGFDRSHYLINRAKTQAKKEGLAITLKEGDARKLPYKNNQFDGVTVLGNSFGYFETQQDDELVLAEILRILKPQGKLLIDITDGDYMRSSFDPRSWEWIDKNYFVCRERSLSADNQRLVSREVITHVRKGVVADQFYAERLYNPGSLQAMLEGNGFSDVGLKQALNTLSQRDQDLGMMARRNIIMGLANKPQEIPLISENRQWNIAVLMGDPRKSDKVKPGESFDDDDLFTINTLKKSLNTLEGYAFSYFDNHENFFPETKQWERNFDLVLNLCDEGFNNNPTFELHVPALLEMKSIPYSGGNPQCLSYCYDKSLVRGLAIEMDIPVAEANFLKPQDTTFVDITIPFPVIIKPNFGDSSFGITQNSVCYSITELEQAILSIRQKCGYESPVLIEEYLTGKDISVGIIGNPSGTFQILPIIEEDYSLLPEGLPRICGYEAKWDQNSPYWKINSIAAELPSATVQFLHDSCLKLFDRTGCRDYARFDWRLDSNGTPRLLEVNPNPGWCWDGHLAKMAKLEGLSYADMLKTIIQVAIEREGVSVALFAAQRANQHW